MEKKETSDKPIKKIINKHQDKILDSIEKEYSKSSQYGKKISEDAKEKIETSTKAGVDYIRSQSYWKSIRDGSNKIKEKSIEQGNEFKKQSPKYRKKISASFFNFFETFVGRIKLGTQYGEPSVELLEKLAKLKELGVLTDEEFTKKKKKILDRI